MVPTVWLANVRLVGEKLTVGAEAAAIVIDNCFVAVCPAESVTVKGEGAGSGIDRSTRQNTRCAERQSRIAGAAAGRIGPGIRCRAFVAAKVVE